MLIRFLTHFRISLIVPFVLVLLNYKIFIRCLRVLWKLHIDFVLNNKLYATLMQVFPEMCQLHLLSTLTSVTCQFNAHSKSPSFSSNILTLKRASRSGSRKLSLRMTNWVAMILLLVICLLLLVVILLFSRTFNYLLLIFIMSKLLRGSWL